MQIYYSAALHFIDLKGLWGLQLWIMYQILRYPVSGLGCFPRPPLSLALALTELWLEILSKSLRIKGPYPTFLSGPKSFIQVGTHLTKIIYFYIIKGTYFVHFSIIKRPISYIFLKINFTPKILTQPFSSLSSSFTVKLKKMSLCLCL